MTSIGVGSTFESHHTEWFVKSQTYSYRTRTLTLNCVPLEDELARRSNAVATHRLEDVEAELGIGSD